MPKMVTCLLLEENGALPDELIDVMKDDEWVPLRGRSAFVLKWPSATENDPAVLRDVTDKLLKVKLALKGMGMQHRFSTMEVGNEDRIKMKVCLVGDKAVGKSSLIRRYVLDQFGDEYLKTMGSKVSKRTLVLEHPRDGREIRVDMTVWDIMGNKGLADLLMSSYVHGAQGIIAVCDVTRKSTLEGLDGWINDGLEVAGDVPIHVLVNKADQHDDFDFSRDDVMGTTNAGSNVTFTSARTGDNVEAAFRDLAMSILSTYEEKDIVEKVTA
ncbi:MAG: GTP-binding protein [Candidatus Thermoplasmatota archaeon]|nr:GTP-binding protein [Candidatus Thermoplasmatota archaeon]